MSFWLEPELQRYFEINGSGVPPPLRQAEQPQPHLQPPSSLSQLSPSNPKRSPANAADLKASVTAALAEDPALAFLLRLDNVLGCRDGVIRCLATVKRNVHHQELQYIQRFKQIAEPAIRHRMTNEKMLMFLDPRTLRCGQQVLLKVHSRSHPAEPLQLLRELSILKSAQDPPAFPKAYLFGCLGNESWRVSSEDKTDSRQIVMHRQHFLLCQHVEDSLQRLIDNNRADGLCLDSQLAIRMCREMLTRLGQLHSTGWCHGCLQPSSFLLPGGDELLLGDLASVEPLARQCLTYRGDRERSPVYASVRYSNSSKLEAAYADLESLVYIVCSLTSPKPLPWESTAAEVDPAAAASSIKLAFWQFIEAESEKVKEELWEDFRLGELFNCKSSSNAVELPAYRLASSIVRMYNTNTESANGSHEPNCAALQETLR